MNPHDDCSCLKCCPGCQDAERHITEITAERDGLDKAVNYALGALLDPDVKRLMAAIAHVTEMVHLAFNPAPKEADRAAE